MVSKRRGTPPAGRVRHEGRGLCGSCHGRASDAGTLPDHERLTRSCDDTVEDYEVLIESGQCRTRAAAAAAMGMGLDALDRALYRAGVDVAAVPRTGARPAGWGRR